ncbi:MAG: hypothetical protein JW807_15985 [Spirochaetes bacterium]|nr:hypothetical protein [Spirochaetota bacterium]
MKPYLASKLTILLLGALCALPLTSCNSGGILNQSIYDRAFLETVETDFGPLDILYVQGSPREIGLQYGYHLNAKIRDGYDTFMAYLTDQGVPKIIAEAGLSIMWSFFKSHVPASYAEEMEGIVEGAGDAGVDIDTAMIERMIALANISDLDISFLDWVLEMFSCSSFAVWGPRTESGKMFSSRNLDWSKDTGIGGYKLVTVYKPDDGPAYATMGFAGFIGALAGMNANGITIGEIGSQSVNQSLSGKPWVLKTRDILSGAANLDEAISIFKDDPNTIGYNFVFAYGDPLGSGASAKGCALETNASVTAVLYDNNARELNAVAIDHDGDVVLDGNGNPVYYGHPLAHAVFRADTAFDPAVRKDQTASRGPGADDYDPSAGYIEGDPHGSGAYENRYMPQYEMINAYYEGTGYTRSGEVLVPADGTRRIIGMNEARRIAAVAASPSSCILSVVYSATDLTFMVAYEKGTGDAWEPAQASEYFFLDLKALVSKF